MAVHLDQGFQLDDGSAGSLDFIRRSVYEA